MEGKPNVQEVPVVTRQHLRKGTQRSEDHAQDRVGSPARLPFNSLPTMQTKADSTLFPTEATLFSLFIYITQK